MHEHCRFSNTTKKKTLNQQGTCMFCASAAVLLTPKSTNETDTALPKIINQRKRIYINISREQNSRNQELTWPEKPREDVPRRMLGKAKQECCASAWRKKKKGRQLKKWREYDWLESGGGDGRSGVQRLRQRLRGEAEAFWFRPYSSRN